MCILAALKAKLRVAVVTLGFVNNPIGSHGPSASNPRAPFDVTVYVHKAVGEKKFILFKRLGPI